MHQQRNVLVTGYPGFLGNVLVARLLARHAPAATLTCLVDAEKLALAEERGRELTGRLELPAESLRLVPSELARYDLGSSPAERRERETVEIFHMAQLADPAAPRAAARRVNVDGTRHVLDMAYRCPHLGRFHHLSTCYVSGRYAGLFREDDFALGQELGNAFEESCYEAEAEVRQRMKDGLDVTIYRPATVVDDAPGGAFSESGGFHELLPYLCRLAERALAPVPGDGDRHHLNVVPRRFVADAIDHLSSLAQSRGKVYHLCDPSAPTIEAVLRLVRELAGRRGLTVPVPRGVARWAVAHAGPLRRRMGLTPELFDYCARPTRYSTRYALRDLASAHIDCPPLRSYLQRILVPPGGPSGKDAPAVA